MMILKIFREVSDAKMPEVTYQGTSGAFDIYATEDIIVWPGHATLVPVGIRILIPAGYYLEFHTRSGHGIKKNLRVHPGIIDHSYTGTLAVYVRNFGVQEQKIEKHTAVAQVTVHKIPEYNFLEINEDEFNDINSKSVRGEKGFGSSDKKENK